MDGDPEFESSPASYDMGKGYGTKMHFCRKNKVYLLTMALGIACVLFLITAIAAFRKGSLPDGGGGGTTNAASSISSLYTDVANAKTKRDSFMSSVDPVQIRGFMQLFADAPHIAGSYRNNYLADVAFNNFVSFGFDDVRREQFPVLLEDLKHRSVNVTNAQGDVLYKCELAELDIMNQTNWTKALPVTNGYSGQGYAKGMLVWANYGREEDFEAIKNIDLHGKIVAVRYGQIFRGNKVKLAQSRGAIGVIIVEDAYDMQKGTPFPDGPWASNYTVQRGSVYTGEGDPLTPSWATAFDGPRLDPNSDDIFNESKMDNNALPTIPVQPMSITDAAQVLKNLGGGNAMPAGWEKSQYAKSGYFAQGIGPGPQMIEMEVRRDLVVKTITNVIATIKGSVEPDRTVTLGSHRDAWTYGAVDPISGHSTIQEIGRGLGKLHKEGWTPRRSIELCSWDAEEWAIIGSIEYVESHLEQLRSRAVAHLNLDTAITGSERASVAGSPSFARLLQQVAAEIDLPAGRGKLDTVLDPLEAPGSGSDHIGFIQLAGVPSIETNFYNTSEPYEAVYHSNYDSLDWVDKFCDPHFEYHATMAKFYGHLAMRLADDNIIPLSVEDYSLAVQGWAQEYSDNGNFSFANFSFLTQATTDFVSASQVHIARVSAAQAKLDGAVTLQNGLNPYELRAINDIQMGLERVFLAFGKEETGQAWYKHVLFTPSAVNSYGHTIMPIIANALATGNAAKANFAIGRIGIFVRSAAAFVNSSFVYPSGR